jgi:hypothetical protein
MLLMMWQAKSCKVISMPVGILTPDWLANSTYLGEESVDNIMCHKWTKADFIIYWADKVSGHPVRWIFLWGMRQMDVLSWKVNGTVPEDSWQAPPYCFSGSPSTFLEAF